MNIKPQNAFVLIKKDPDEERVSDHGIIMRAGVVYEQLVPATVIALGPKCGRFKLVKGDRILIHPSAGAMIKIEEKEHHFVREIDIKAKLEPDRHEPV